MAKADKTQVKLTPELEKFKYEVAQEIGILNRRRKETPTT